jgi:segregation and condensation protein B
LAIIIYNQPVTRPEIEKLRGVDCSGPLLTLLERKLVRIEGRAKKPGGPFLYGTGKEFLRYFGLASLNDLPSKDELQAFLLRQGETQ